VSRALILITFLTCPSAGVIGLTVAAFLAENGFRVTIISKDIPGDFSDQYASPWAGAHWRSHAPAHELEQCDWDMQSYDYFVKLMEAENRNPEQPRSGVKVSVRSASEL
jgi:glycine/D-amino acid oxidase-like deaminating enzyme